MSNTLGPYELRGELGRGAMAVVWRAWDPALEREVAIKEPLFAPTLEESVRGELTARFLREGKTVAAFNHAGIVTVYAADVYDGRPAIVMELIKGSTLAEVLERGALSPQAAAAVADQLLDALAYAHSRGVVHRDIKPDNVFVTVDGRVKLADFGIARVAERTRFTQEGTVMGTPGYMAPEQVRGLSADERADIFATGAILYEMLAGENPFGASAGIESTAIMYRIVHEDPPPLPPETGDPLRTVALVALNKDPEARFASAEEMRSALAGAGTQRSVVVARDVAYEPRRPSGLIVALVSVLATALVAGAAWAIWPRTPSGAGPGSVGAVASVTTEGDAPGDPSYTGPSHEELVQVSTELRSARESVEHAVVDVGVLGVNPGVAFPRSIYGNVSLDAGKLRQLADIASGGTEHSDAVVVEASRALVAEAQALQAYQEDVEGGGGTGEAPYQLALARYFGWYARVLLVGNEREIESLRAVQEASRQLPDGLDLWFPFGEDLGPPTIHAGQQAGAADRGVDYVFDWSYVEGFYMTGRLLQSPQEASDLLWYDASSPGLKGFAAMQAYEEWGMQYGTVAWVDPRLVDRSGYPTQYPVGGYMMDAAIARDRFEYSMAVLPSGGGVFD